VANILVVDDEPGIREFMVDTLATDGHSLSEAADGTAALQRLREQSYDLLFTDLRMPGNVDGMGVLREARASHPDMKVIVLTAHGSVASAVDAMKLGAHDFLEKPVSGPTELRILVSRALDGPYEASGESDDPPTSTDRLRRQLARALGADYTVEGLVGKGGYAAVFTVNDKRLDRRLAAKVLLPQFATVEDTAERFRREARMMGRLSHPNILPVYFVGRDRDVPCFVMPYISGGSLATLVERHGRLAMPVVLRVARELASALDFAHHMGVVHRDLKPENILIDQESGRSILADFGIAKAVAPESAATAPGVFLGTPRYSSPEQAAGELEINERSDVYSFGVVVYEMISGRTPFDGSNASKILAQHLVAPVPQLRKYLPDVVNRQTDAVIARALAKDPVDRFSSAGAFVLALEVAVRNGGGGR